MEYDRQTGYILMTIIIMVFIAFSTVNAHAEPSVDNTLYASLLKSHVIKNRVNYDGFKKDEQKLDTYLAILSSTDIDSLSKTEQFAFYINAYNAFTIKLILTRYPGINSIKEIGTFFTNPWQKKFIKLQKRSVTLDYIEHDILRPIFKDPRVHFAINCASKSCPPLRNEPYEPSTLEDQLDNQTKKFINDKKNNFLKNNILFLSKIFAWFDEDFSDKPVQFIQRFANDELKATIRSAGQDIKLKYLPYDWSLNR
ncbi:MAG: DUF547 domain-containing protein [Desulfobacula sp.]|nr:DUF547 domain-containing protein [Desulfobacula sp.]